MKKRGLTAWSAASVNPSCALLVYVSLLCFDTVLCTTALWIAKLCSQKCEGTESWSTGCQAGEGGTEGAAFLYPGVGEAYCYVRTVWT